MKATELKLGDWVKYLYITKFVNAIITDFNGELAYLSINGIDNYSSFVEYLKPIPLTKEILEKNGWQWDEDDWVFYSEFCPHVYLAPNGKGFNVVDATGEQLGRINAAVHELQHLLWALGIDDDLKI